MVTVEEFNIMVEELLFNETVSYDMLCKIAEKVLRPKVVNWCLADVDLNGRNCEDDIMQDIHVRLMKTTITHFLLKDGVEEYNNNPRGFNGWIITVAENIKKDHANRLRRRNFNTTGMDDPEAEGLSTEDSHYKIECVEKLKEAFNLVLNSNLSIYKVLSWFGQAVFILGYDITKIQSTHLLVSSFEKKTLFEMHDRINETAKKVVWLKMSAEQNKKIMSALEKPWDEYKVYGAVEYKEFFMKKGGNDSISDWINKINKIIRGKLDE